ncbi:MAG: MFS transporter [Desulfobulbaceae bacterium A2]|nr:MAG: MFS transporter [Desulfobulbaceae bacterium A2]
MHGHALAPLLLSVYIALLGIGIIVPVMPVYAVSLGATGFTLGLIIAAFSVSRGLCQPFFGSLSDRFGRKLFLVLGLLVYALVGLAIPQATSLTGLIAIRALHGVGSAMIVPVAMAYVGDHAPDGQEGRNMSLLNIAIFSGMGSGPLLGGICVDLWGMQAAFYAMAGMSGLALVLVLRLLPTTTSGRGTRTSRIGLLTAMGSMLSSRRTAGLLLARMATMIIMVPTMAFLPLLMQQWFQASGMWIGLVISARTLVNAMLQTPCGRMADRGDKVRLLRIGTLIIVGVMCLTPLAGNCWWLLMLFVVLGMGEALIWPTLGALATEEGRGYGQGTMMGVYNLAMSCGVFLGAIGAGLSSDIFGLSWSFVCIGAIVFFLTMGASVLIGSSKRASVCGTDRHV